MERGDDGAGQEPVDPLRLRVATGADGSLDLYEDQGSGSGFREGASATIPISYTETVERSPGYARDDSLLSIGPGEGSYPGQPERRGYEVEFLDVAAPSEVRVDGRPLAADEWSYDPAGRVLTVTVGTRPTSRETTVSFESE